MFPMNDKISQLEFQSALHPKVKGIFVVDNMNRRVVEFQSALHPKVKGIFTLSWMKSRRKSGFNPPFTQRWREFTDIKLSDVGTWFQSALHPKVKGISRILGPWCNLLYVSIRPSPKGEGNLFWFQGKSILDLFQSALHPKVKGIERYDVDLEKLMKFQSALHPKVKGISRCGLFALSFEVSIRPSPKGEGNSDGTVGFIPIPWFQSALHPKVKGIIPIGSSRSNFLGFNPPFTQRWREFLLYFD